MSNDRNPQETLQKYSHPKAIAVVLLTVFGNIFSIFTTSVEISVAMFIQPQLGRDSPYTLRCNDRKSSFRYCTLSKGKRFGTNISVLIFKKPLSRGFLKTLVKIDFSKNDPYDTIWNFNIFWKAL